MTTLLFLAALWLSPTLSAQPLADTTLARQYYEHAQSDAEYDSAIVYLKKAIQVFKREGQHDKYIQHLRRLSRCYTNTDRYDTAMRYVQQALEEGKKLLGRESIAVARAYDEMGYTLIGMGQYDSALVSYQQAKELLEGQYSESYEDLADLYNGMACTYQMMSMYNSAEAYCQKALTIGKQHFEKDSRIIADTYFRLGNLSLLRIKYDSALLFFQQSLAIEQQLKVRKPISISVILSCIGIVYRQKGNHQQALAYYKKALAIGEATNSKNSSVVQNYAKLADIYTHQGKFDLALQYHRKSLLLNTKVLGKNHPDLAYDYFEQGWTYYEMKDYQNARICYQKALSITQGVTGREDLSADIYDHLGLNYQAVHQYDSAFKYHLKALNILKISHNKDYSYVYAVYENIGKLHYSQQQYDSALLYHYQGLAAYDKNFEDKDAYVSELYNDIAKTWLQLNNDSALHYYQTSLQANATAFAPVSLNDNPSAHDYLNGLYFLEALQGKAQAWEKRYHHTGQPADLQAAFHTYQVCDTLITQLRSSYQYHNDRLRFAQTSAKVYRSGIRVSLQLANVTTQSPTSAPANQPWTDPHFYTHQAFAWSQQGKASALRQAQQEAQALQSAGIPDTLLSKEESLQAERAFYRSQLQVAEQNEVQRYEQRLFDLNRAYDTLMHTLEVQYPRYYQLKYARPTSALAEVQATLAAHTVLLDYTVDDSLVYLFAVTAKGSTAHTFVLDTGLRQAIRQLDSAFGQASEALGNTLPQEAFRAYCTAAHLLYRRLLAPYLPPGHDRLVILPDGLLYHVPFDVLLTQPVTDRYSNMRTLPYLLQHYRTSYAYTARPARHQPPPGRAPRYLALAPDQWQGLLLPLRWNQQEAQAIGKHLEGQSMVGDKASERYFRQAAGQYQVLHLATHAQTNRQDPMLSRLAFSSTAHDTVYDGWLHAYELYDMKLSAQLAVLSACRTGAGPLAQGEGLMSLARGFAYAGCPGVVMSRWEVEDAATAQLMDYFYAALASGQPKDEALWQAKRQYLAQASVHRLHPYFWGGLMFIGDATPLVRPPAWWAQVVVGVLSLVALGLFLGERSSSLSKKLLHS